VRSSAELSWRRQLKRLCPRPIRSRRHLILLAVCTAHREKKERTEKLHSQGVINDGARACHCLLLQRRSRRDGATSGLAWPLANVGRTSVAVGALHQPLVVHHPRTPPPVPQRIEQLLISVSVAVHAQSCDNACHQGCLPGCVPQSTHIYVTRSATHSSVRQHVVPARAHSKQQHAASCARPRARGRMASFWKF
jgi:hypothetical protein